MLSDHFLFVRVKKEAGRARPSKDYFYEAPIIKSALKFKSVVMLSTMADDQGRYRSCITTGYYIYLIDVPPLEDCSEFFTTPSSTEPTRDRDTVETPVSAVQDDGGFAGMKKGFLNKAKTSKKKASDDIPFIKPSKPADVSNLQIPEVQEALKTPLLGSNGEGRIVVYFYYNLMMCRLDNR